MAQMNTPEFFRLTDEDTTIDLTRRQLEELDKLISDTFGRGRPHVRQTLVPTTPNCRPIEVRMYFDGGVSIAYENDAAIFCDSLEGLKDRLSHA
jgi:hypothetical protein